ncbi:MAG: recombinase RecT [Elusimicrobia bacterium]|nr:recombinase RecT [Elusimicrobiota bacterium]
MTTEAAPKDKAVAAKRKTLPELLGQVDTREMFTRMLGKDADGFQQNIMTVYNSGLREAGCEPESIIAACAISASLGLSILPGLGQSCIVPYKDGDKVVAQWQIMVRGVIQLAHRSGQYKHVNAARVYEGQLLNYDEHKSLVKLRAEKKSDRVQGYYFWFELNSGLSMEFYWSAEKCIEHGLRFSKSFQKGSGKWAEDPEFVKAGSVKKWLAAKEHFLTEGSGADAMSAKTSVKNPLLKWGPLDTKIKETVQLDQAVIGVDGTPKYVDTTAEPAAPAKTYTAPPMTPSGDQPFPAEKIKWARDAAEKLGVSNEQFDAWIAAQPGDEHAKAEAATVAWKKVAAKQATAKDVFSVVETTSTPADNECGFKVSGAATTDFGGNPDCYIIRDTSDPVVKYYTDQEAVFKAAKAAQKDDRVLGVKWIEKPSGKNVVRWITQLAA